MHVDVSHILSQDRGVSVDYKIDGERPDLGDVKLTEPLSGHIHVLRTEDGILVRGRMQTSVELECHRCLRTFTHTLTFPVDVEFTQQPSEEEFPISPKGVIDLDEPIRQDLIVHLPQRQLCSQDCTGIKVEEKHGSS